MRTLRREVSDGGANTDGGDAMCDPGDREWPHFALDGCTRGLLPRDPPADVGRRHVQRRWPDGLEYLSEMELTKAVLTEQGKALLRFAGEHPED